ncbi:hypothetical protein CK623_10945 [Vandammella animalimorsus]|uniref:DUF883 domain-containing protein n=1 Tax=Vandammella animalimorsus TaxID=2029117 RepID=A0A2A2AN65_9BURK|nr:hypothetical protein [Vandammella animalimorsus]PAT39266.1 hypothetical protein CK623_10945 [Vandammella animalimorsus]
MNTHGKNPVENAADAAEATVRKAASQSVQAIEKGVDKAAGTAQALTDKTLEGVERGLSQARQAIDSGLEKAEYSVRSLHQRSDPAIDALAHKALDVATQSINLVADTSERARQRVQELSEATNRYVVEKPGKSLLMAAAAGAILTLLLTGRRSR